MGSALPLSGTDWEISTETERLDRKMIHAFLSGSYWASGIPQDLVDRSIDNSFCFGVYDQGRQIAFARVITDFATFGYLADVFVVETHRGRGIGKKLIGEILNHPKLKPMRRIMLATLDAHKLYAPFGFTELTHPERFMQIRRPDPYGKPTAN